MPRADRPADTLSREEKPSDQTEREIFQQPDLWRQMREIAAHRIPDVRGWLGDVVADPSVRILLSGAGTSSYAGEIAAPYLRRVLGRRVEAISTTDIVSAPSEALAENLPTLLISIARSGNSPESLAATSIADEVLTSCKHLVVTCNPDGALAAAHRNRLDSRLITMPAAANDQGLAMTSSFTCMLLTILLVLGTEADEGDIVERLALCADSILANRRQAIDEVVAQEPSGVVYLGGPGLQGLAHESALKVMELTAGRVMSSHETVLAFRHGPKAVLSKSPAVIVYVSNDPYTRLYDLDMLSEILSESVENAVIVVISATGEGIPPRARLWDMPGLGGVPDAFVAIPAVLHAQLLGISWSRSLGLNPNNPFPAGRVNRVVQGVKVHPRKPRTHQ